MNDFLSKLSISSGLSVEYLKYVISNADKSYLKRQFSINNKKRIFYIPSEEVKLIQNLIVDLYLSNITISKNSHAYVKGRSIKTNALSHKESSFFVQTDIVSFFPSIKSPKIKEVILEFKKKHPELLNLSDEAVNNVVKIIAPFGRLDLGSSTSPIISNIIMYKFDCTLNEKLQHLMSNPVYTRYSDDITISSDKEFDHIKVLKLVKDLLLKEGFKINTKKTKYIQNKDRIKITGVFLGVDKKLTVGSIFKKRIKHSLYKATMESQTEEETLRILGMLSFLKDIEPSYYYKLILKYSNSEQSIFDIISN